MPTNCRHENVTLNDILDKYLKERVPEMRSADSEGSRARKMQKCMGHLRLQDISIKFLEEYKATRLGPLEVRVANRKAGPRQTNYLRQKTHVSSGAQAKLALLQAVENLNKLLGTVPESLR